MHRDLVAKLVLPSSRRSCGRRRSRSKEAKKAWPFPPHARPAFDESDPGELLMSTVAFGTAETLPRDPTCLRRDGVSGCVGDCTREEPRDSGCTVTESGPRYF